MPTIHHVLLQKGDQVHTIEPTATVLEAIRRMAAKDIGSLLVIDAGCVAGIFTERHYARNVFLKGRSSPQTTVGEVMESMVVCIRPEQSVEEGMALMSDKRVRHLPVMENDRLLGLVSIGDLVKAIISDREFVIEQLEHYISR